MHADPPIESRIKVEADRNDNVRLILPEPKREIARYGVSAFLIFWLCGWAYGWISVFHAITSGAKNGGFFAVVWLGAWTVGGGFAIWTLWRMLRPSVPETLVFAKPNLIYDTGIQPPPISFGYSRGADMWKKMFQKRRQIEFTGADIATIKLRDTDADNRLTIDQRNDRIDLGRTLSEVEREWLFQLIRQEYAV